MSKKTIEELRSGKEFVNHALHHQNLIDYRQRGSHFIGETEKGMVVIPNHDKDLGIGIRKAIIKTMLAIGLGIFLVVIL